MLLRSLVRPPPRQGGGRRFLRAVRFGHGDRGVHTFAFAGTDEVHDRRALQGQVARNGQMISTTSTTISPSATARSPTTGGPRTPPRPRPCSARANWPTKAARVALGLAFGTAVADSNAVVSAAKFLQLSLATRMGPPRCQKDGTASRSWPTGPSRWCPEDSKAVKWRSRAPGARGWRDAGPLALAVGLALDDELPRRALQPVDSGLGQ